MNSALERPVAIDGRLKRAFDSSLLARRLREACRGDVLFDAASRGRYATDASIYQIDPIGVVVPRDEDDVRAALAIARELDVPVLAARRGLVAMRPDGRRCAGDRSQQVAVPRFWRSTTTR